MSKYEGLTNFLKRQSGEEIRMTFDEVSQHIEARLPKSAVLYRMWWSNNTSNHVHAKAWVDAGFQTEQVDMNAKKLVFRRLKRTHQSSSGNASRGLSESHRMFKVEKSPETQSGLHPMIGAMKGTFTIEPGWDLAKPALDPEELAEWDASLERKATLTEQVLAKRK
jgi:thiamine kinase-like enzyme